MILALIFIWYLLGVASFIYWWTKDFDLTFVEIPVMLLAGVIGIFAFWVGWVNHGESVNWLNKPVIKRRGEL